MDDTEIQAALLQVNRGLKTKAVPGWSSGDKSLDRFQDLLRPCIIGGSFLWSHRVPAMLHRLFHVLLPLQLMLVPLLAVCLLLMLPILLTLPDNFGEHAPLLDTSNLTGPYMLFCYTRLYGGSRCVFNSAFHT